MGNEMHMKMFGFGSAGRDRSYGPHQDWLAPLYEPLAANNDDRSAEAAQKPHGEVFDLESIIRLLME